MKNIFLLFFLIFAITSRADQPYEPKYEILGDSVKFSDGQMMSIDDFLVDFPEERYKLENRKKSMAEIENQKKEEEKKDDYKFDKTWKFYAVIFAFPVILLFFVLLVLKSRRKNQNL